MIDRIPPQSIDTEESVLAYCLLGNDIDELMDILTPDDFYRSAHAKIFTVIRELVKAKEPVDLLTTAKGLMDREELEEIGGAVYLSSIVNDCPLSPNAISHAKIIREKSARRRLIEIANNLAKSAYDEQQPTADILDATQKQILGVSLSDNKQDAVPISKIIEDGFEHLETISQNDGTVSGLPSGLTMLDGMTCGFEKSDLILIAARPSMGKTALAMNIAKTVAENGYPVQVFSLEMANRPLGYRMLSSSSGVNGMKFRTAKFSADEWERIAYAGGVLSRLPIYVDDSSSLTHAEICRRSRQAVHKRGIKCIVADYLTYILCDGDKKRVYAVEEITRSLKALAKDLNVPFILLSQLNRQCEQRTDKRPMLSDLRDSGAIEQDADVVIFLYRDEVYNKSEDNPNSGRAEIIVAKQRNGPTGTVTVQWDAKTTTFHNLANENWY